MRAQCPASRLYVWRCGYGNDLAALNAHLPFSGGVFIECLYNRDIVDDS
jgi:hypothetical protein